MIIFDFLAALAGLAALVFFWLFLDKYNECIALKHRCKIEKEQYDKTITKLEKEIRDYECLCSGIDCFILNADKYPFIRIFGLNSNVIGKWVSVKSFRYNPDDPEDSDFAVRNAMELMDEIKKA